MGYRKTPGGITDQSTKALHPEEGLAHCNVVRPRASASTTLHSSVCRYSAMSMVDVGPMRVGVHHRGVNVFVDVGLGNSGARRVHVLVVKVVV